MNDRLGKDAAPNMDVLGVTTGCPLLEQFGREIQDRFRCKPKMEYSSCSWEPGWNVKFKKAGRTLCTVYPREGYFTVMVVVGAKEREQVEMILPDLVPELQEIWNRTREGNGQRWLMIDLEEAGPLYEGVMQLIRIREESRR